MHTPNTTRRGFFRATTLGITAAASTVAASNNARAQAAFSGRTLTEPAREIPLVDACDVVVCGGGPAGVTAAIAAARAGAKTRLIESAGCLGGVWTAGLLCVVIDYANKSGLMREYIDRLESPRKAIRYGHWIYHPEHMKRLLEAMCAEAGVSLRLHTRSSAAVVDDRQRVAAVVTDSKSGREAFTAKVFIDATGDGDLAAQAGCAFDYGRPEDGYGQPMSLIALIDGLDPEEIALFTRGLAEPRGEQRPKHRFREELERAGFKPSYSSPSLFLMPGDLFCMVSNHMYGFRPFDADDVTRATVEARAEIHAAVDALRKLGRPWANMEVVTTAEQIGIRDGRRIRGLYTVTEEDLAVGQTHDDAVCRVTFGVDVHAPNPEKSRGFDHGKTRAKPYDIPYRSLIAEDVRGLLLAGRCISGDFIAHSSYRVTGDAVRLGEAAGVAAALAAKNGCLPEEVVWEDLAAALIG